MSRTFHGGCNVERDKQLQRYAAAKMGIALDKGS